MPIKYGLGNNQKDIHVSAAALGKVKYGNTTVWQKSLPTITFAGNSIVRGLSSSDVHVQYIDDVGAPYAPANIFNGVRDSGSPADTSIPITWFIQLDQVRTISEIEFAMYGTIDNWVRVYTAPYEYMFPDDNRWQLKKTFTPAEIQVAASKYYTLPTGAYTAIRWIKLEIR